MFIEPKINFKIVILWAYIYIYIYLEEGFCKSFVVSPIEPILIQTINDVTADIFVYVLTEKISNI